MTETGFAMDVFKVGRRLVNQFPIWGSLSLVLWTTVSLAQDAPPGPPPNDPLVVKPTTISGNFDAALLMVKLARLDLAKYYLQQMLDLSPSDEDLMALRAKHGTGAFLELARLKELSPPADQLLNLVTEAVRHQVDQPGYADTLVAKLNGGVRERTEALAELQHLGADAVPPILRSLGGDSNVGRDTLSLTLARLGPEAVPPLIGALTSPNLEIRTVAAEVLGKIGAASDIVWLWAPAFEQGLPSGLTTAARTSIARLKYGDAKLVGRVSLDGVTSQMLQIANQHLTGTYPWSPIYEEKPEIPVWVWSADKGTVVNYPVTRSEASLYFAERIARDAATLSPDSELPPVIVLASLLTRAVEANKWNQPLPIGENSVMELAVRTGPELNDKVLRYALDHKLSAAAIGSLEALALNGSVPLLQNKDGRSAIIEALDAPDQRVQFTAAQTILKWEPSQPFPASRRVLEIIVRAVNSDGRSASVVMDPNVPRSLETAALFAQLGFKPQLARTGMQGFEVAAGRGDVALAVLHPNVIRWELTQTINNLRSDARTADMPIIIYGPKAIRGRFDDLISQFQKVAYVDEGVTSGDISREMQPFLVQLNPPMLTKEQHEQQLQIAAGWLRRIALRDLPQVFDLTPFAAELRQASHVTTVAEDIMIALGAIGTADVQEEFFSIATAPAATPELRQLAAYQLAYHIQRHGLLLPPASAATLTDVLKNESDPQVQLALASVVGSLKPTPAAARKALLARPLSASPVLQPAVEQ